MRLSFDIETNGLLDTVNRVHCIVIQDVDTMEMYRFTPDKTEEALALLDKATMLIAHNGIKYDIPALGITNNWEPPKGIKIIDTLVLSRLVFPDIYDRTIARNQQLPKELQVPKALAASHSLKAWGYRLQILKGDFGQQEKAWEKFTPEMLEYCEQDVVITTELFKRLEARIESQTAVDLEMDIACIIAKQERAGFPFDVEKATDLAGELLDQREELRTRLEETFEPTIIKLKTKVKEVPFNPASRQQIAYRLMHRGWEPKEFTPSGQPKIDETVLESMNIPEAKLLSRYFLLQKRLGQLLEGKQAWLKVQRNGKIHGSCNTGGAVTGRATHSYPNIAQVPASRAEYGSECRSLFTAEAGYKLLGTDASGLELRCLAHRLAKYDGGDYVRVILEGDVHTTNQKAAGLPTRDSAKTFIYALLYGAGDAKIGSIINGSAHAGKKLREKFMKSLPAFEKLKNEVQTQAREGFLWGLDGRKIPVRSLHSSLNAQLQSDGALICKKWIITFHELMEEAGYTHGEDFIQHAWVHDEIQMSVREEIADAVGAIAVKAIEKTGEFFDYRCPLTGDFGVGDSWLETH